jgi:hypothetical protein
MFETYRQLGRSWEQELLDTAAPRRRNLRRSKAEWSTRLAFLPVRRAKAFWLHAARRPPVPE